MKGLARVLLELGQPEPQSSPKQRRPIQERKRLKQAGQKGVRLDPLFARHAELYPAVVSHALPPLSRVKFRHIGIKFYHITATFLYAIGLGEDKCCLGIS